MIKSDFYPGVSPVSGVDLQWTNTLTNLNIGAAVDPFNAYYMGETSEPYVKRGTFTRTGESGSYVWHLRTDTTYKNHWFYAAKNTGESGTTMEYIPSSGKWTGTYRLLNRFLPYYYNHVRQIDAQFTMYDFSNTATLSSGDTLRYTTTGYNSGIVTMNQDVIWNFFTADTPITVTFNGVNYAIKYSHWNRNLHAFDLGDNKIVYVETLNDGAESYTPARTGRYYNAFDLRFAVFATVSCDNLVSAESWHFGNVYCTFATNTSVLYQWNLRGSNSTLISPVMLPGPDYTYRPAINENFVGWFYDCDITEEQLNWTQDSTNQNKYALTSGNVPIIYSGPADIKMFWGIDIVAWYNSVFGAIPKFRTFYNADGTAVTPDDNTTLYNSYNAVPIFNNKNVFQRRVKSAAYQTLEPLLQPWQKYGFEIADDEYSTEPVPGPTPRPDPTDPGDNENDGDDIVLPIPSGIGGAFGFITQYAISNSQLEYLGTKLYTEFFNDADFYKNFMYVLQNTGSINLSSMMEFFISLRAYPFPLVNLTSWTPAGNDFYIGSGVKPILNFPTNLHTINQFIDYVDCGTLTVPAYFGDYRDYDMQITLYLPYCGTAELSPGDVVGGTLSAYYLVDFCSGSCTAYVNCTTYDGKTFPVATLPGNIAADVPLSATNAGQVAARLQGDVLNVEQTLVNGVFNMASGLTSALTGGLSGNLFGSLSAGVRGLRSKYDTIFDLGKQAINAAGRGAIAAPLLSGGRGFSSFGNATTAYIQIRFDVYPDLDNYGDSVGNPAADYVRVGDCSGFNKFINVNVSDITADANDLIQIKKLLENGIYI